MFQVMAYFFLIVALLAGGLYLTRNGFGIMTQKAKGERKLVISETRTLGNRQFLIVAEYDNRKMLLGVCPGRIDYLSTLAGGSDETFSTELQDKPE
jgi:flagellar protein FliO/FliZ